MAKGSAKVVVKQKVVMTPVNVMTEEMVGVTLDLTLKEARVLCVLLRNVGGSTDFSYRKYSDNVEVVLSKILGMTGNGVENPAWYQAITDKYSTRNGIFIEGF